MQEKHECLGAFNVAAFIIDTTERRAEDGVVEKENR